VERGARPPEKDQAGVRAPTAGAADGGVVAIVDDHMQTMNNSVKLVIGWWGALIRLEKLFANSFAIDKFRAFTGTKRHIEFHVKPLGG
jgi:hypothetical protein